MVQEDNRNNNLRSRNNRRSNRCNLRGSRRIRNSRSRNLLKNTEITEKKKKTTTKYVTTTTEKWCFFSRVP